MAHGVFRVCPGGGRHEQPPPTAAEHRSHSAGIRSWARILKSQTPFYSFTPFSSCILCATLCHDFRTESAGGSTKSFCLNTCAFACLFLTKSAPLLQGVKARVLQDETGRRLSTPGFHAPVTRSWRKVCEITPPSCARRSHKAAHKHLLRLHARMMHIFAVRSRHSKHSGYSSFTMLTEPGSLPGLVDLVAFDGILRLSFPFYPFSPVYNHHYGLTGGVPPRWLLLRAGRRAGARWPQKRHVVNVLNFRQWDCHCPKHRPVFCIYSRPIFYMYSGSIFYIYNVILHSIYNVVPHSIYIVLHCINIVYSTLLYIEYIVPYIVLYIGGCAYPRRTGVRALYFLGQPLFSLNLPMSQ